MEKHLISLIHERDAAKHLGVSISWLQRARWAKTGPRYIKVGGPKGRAVRYRHDDLKQWMESNIVETSDTGGNHDH